MQFLADVVEDLIYYVQKDWRKIGAVILIIFFAGFTAGCSAGHVVENSIIETINGK